MVKINEMKNNSDLLSVAEIQEIYQLGYEGGLYNAKEEGIQKGKKEGILENTIEMIKSMLKNNAKYDFISKVSGKSINEIKKIERTM